MYDAWQAADQPYDFTGASYLELPNPVVGFLASEQPRWSMLGTA